MTELQAVSPFQVFPACDRGMAFCDCFRTFVGTGDPQGIDKWPEGLQYPFH